MKTLKEVSAAKYAIDNAITDKRVLVNETYDEVKELHEHDLKGLEIAYEILETVEMGME